MTIGGTTFKVYELTDLQVHDFFVDLEAGRLGTHMRDRYMQHDKVIPFSLVQASCEEVDLDILIRANNLTPSEVGEIYDKVLEVNDFLSKGLTMATTIGQATILGTLMTAGSEKQSSS
jgi:hypothetical protein